MIDNKAELVYDSDFSKIIYFPECGIIYNKWRTESILMSHLQSELIIWKKIFLAKKVNKLITDDSLQQILSKEQAIWINSFILKTFENKKIRWALIIPQIDKWYLKRVENMLNFNLENISSRYFETLNDDVFNWLLEENKS